MQQANSQALIIARESRGLSQAIVAEAAGISQGLISKAENDLHPLTASQVDAIAQLLDYPAEFFYEPGRLRDGASMCHYHRKRKTLPKGVLNRVNATMFVRNVNVRHIMHGLEIEGSRRFHALDLDEFGTPERVARALRTSWRVPEGPVVNLTSLVESAGGIVILAPFGHRKLFGMSCWPTTDYPLFYLNSEIPMADLRWTLAHELAHLTMHGSPSANNIETEADEFAAEFLMPGGTIAPDLKGLTFDRLGPLKLHWRVSMKTVIRRADSLRAISSQQATRLYKMYSARRFNASEPFDIPYEHPTILARAAKVHIEEHKYTIRDLLDAVRLSRGSDFAEVTGMAPPHRNLSAVR